MANSIRALKLPGEGRTLTITPTARGLMLEADAWDAAIRQRALLRDPQDHQSRVLLPLRWGSEIRRSGESYHWPGAGKWPRLSVTFCPTDDRVLVFFRRQEHEGGDQEVVWEPSVEWDALLRIERAAECLTNPPRRPTRSVADCLPRIERHQRTTVDRLETVIDLLGGSGPGGPAPADGPRPLTGADSTASMKARKQKSPPPAYTKPMNKILCLDPPLRWPGAKRWLVPLLCELCVNQNRMLTRTWLRSLTRPTTREASVRHRVRLPRRYVSKAGQRRMPNHTR